MQSQRLFSLRFVLGCVVLLAIALPSWAADVAPLVEKGVAFLEKSQAEDGSFSSESGTGVTSLVTAALLKSGKTADDPVVAKALDYLKTFVQADGGIYKPGSTHRNYETCIAVTAFHLANTDGRYDDLVKNAAEYIKEVQWDSGEGHNEESMNYGGAGYGSHSRPDLSNTSFLIDTLKELGTSEDDPAIQKALVFVSRCQNLKSEHNQTEFADKIGDGGFYYTIAAGGTSQAGAEPDGGLRSYGSMTYAGLKSMIYAGVDADDERVKAALDWIAKHYTLEENPGMADSGLYYYYHTFAKSLSAVGKDELVDDSGKAHDWKADLVAELAKRQQPDGSWSNTQARWLEDDPNLVTAYVLLALSYAK
jgi:squalene-hopene/tetraprenyl-beta-curcumene cyclase